MLTLRRGLPCLQIIRQYEELQQVEEELARTDAGAPLATGLVEQTEDQLQRPLKGYQVCEVPQFRLPHAGMVHTHTRTHCTAG